MSISTSWTFQRHDTELDGRNKLFLESAMLRIQQLAAPVIWVLLGLGVFTSQYFFLRFEPAPLRDDELWKINAFAACIGICYYRSCTVDPGRIPRDWKPSDQRHLEGINGRQRWCRKCEAFKPPRAHHCRTCGRYVILPLTLRLVCI